jgi:hypothetical protein
VPGGGAANEKFEYGVPNAQSCQKCHATENAGGRGNLNKDCAYDAATVANQLAHWDSLKILSGFPGVANAPKSADWRDATQSLEARVKACLDVNCAHCHSPRGNAFQTGLMLDHATVGNAATSAQWGVCKKPLAYGGPSVPCRYGIEPGKADESLLLYRMSHAGTADVMPALGRKVNHDEAIAMVRDWIMQLALPACL